MKVERSARRIDEEKDVILAGAIRRTRAEAMMDTVYTYKCAYHQLSLVYIYIYLKRNSAKSESGEESLPFLTAVRATSAALILKDISIWYKSSISAALRRIYIYVLFLIRYIWWPRWVSPFLILDRRDQLLISRGWCWMWGNSYSHFSFSVNLSLILGISTFLRQEIYDPVHDR